MTNYERIIKFIDGLNMDSEETQRVLLRIIYDYSLRSLPLGNERLIVSPMPESDDDRPVVEVRSHPSEENTYCADKENVKTLCSFHELLPPREEDFKKHGSEELHMETRYQGKPGSFLLRFYLNRPFSILELKGGFTLQSFIPIRVEVINK